MKWYHLSVDTSVPGHAWYSFYWQAREVLAKTVATSSIDVLDPTGSDRTTRLSRFRERLAGRAARLGTIRRLDQELDATSDAVLEVHGISHSIVRSSSMLDPIWDRFTRRILTVTDAIEPTHFAPHFLARFDLIRCFCPALARSYRECAAVPVLFQPTGIDALDQVATTDFRPIDMIVVGRRWSDFHQSVHPHYNRPNSRRLFLDFGTRPQAPGLPEHEWRLLMATHAKSKIAFCFEPSGNPRFAGRSSMTHRWPQAWTSGCTVVGHRPRDPELVPYFDWPESTLEIPDSPSEWIPFLESVLDDEAGLLRRRHRNALEALRRHDGRARMRDLLRVLGLPLPERLRDELARLDSTIAALEQRHGLPPLDPDWERAAPTSHDTLTA